MRPEVELFGKQAFTACALTHRFLSTFAPRIETATEFSEDAAEFGKMRLATLRGYYARTMGWMNSVAKLNQPDDVQAVSVAARSLFEKLVDLVLLRYATKKNEAFEQMFDFERSAILAHAESVMAFFRGQPPPEYAGFTNFLDGPEVKRIKASRRRWYQQPKHPGGRRWTGNHLAEDAQEADRLLADVGRRAGDGLYAFHELEHPRLCWAAHGSGLTGLRSSNDDLIPAQCASRLNRVHDFALLIVQLALEELGLFLQVEFDDFRRLAADEIAAVRTAPR